MRLTLTLLLTLAMAGHAQTTIDLGYPSACMDSFTRATPDAPCTSRITAGNKSVLWTEVHGHVTGVETQSGYGHVIWHGSAYTCDNEGPCKVPSPAEIAVHAQSVPATYPDRMDGKNCHANGLSAWCESDSLLVPPTDPSGMVLAWTGKGYSWIDLPPCAKPPAKHHTRAPQPHKSHARRKAGK